MFFRMWPFLRLEIWLGLELSDWTQPGLQVEAMCSNSEIHICNM